MQGAWIENPQKQSQVLLMFYYFCFPWHSVAKHLPPSDDWQLRLFANIFLTPILVTSIFTQPALCPGPGPGVCQLDGAAVCLRHAMYGMMLIDFSWGSRSTQTPYSFKSTTLNYNSIQFQLLSYCTFQWDQVHRYHFQNHGAATHFPPDLSLSRCVIFSVIPIFGRWASAMVEQPAGWGQNEMDQELIG